MWPPNRSMPGMPGSFARSRGPLAISTKRARMRSPRSVVTCQAPSPSSQRMPVTLVWKQASS